MEKNWQVIMTDKVTNKEIVTVFFSEDEANNFYSELVMNKNAGDEYLQQFLISIVYPEPEYFWDEYLL